MTEKLLTGTLSLNSNKQTKANRNESGELKSKLDKLLAVDNRDDNNSEKTNDHIATKLTDSDDIDNHIGDKS